MRLKTDTDDFNIYVARNVSGVQEAHRSHQSTWLYSPSLPWKAKTVRLNPFENSCVGVLNRNQYTITLHKFRVNYWQVAMTVIGIGLFLYAPSLCRNAFFHYTTGVGAGVFLSLVLLTFLLQRKLNLGRWVLACYSLSVYFLTSAMYNIKTYLIQYHVYVLGYLLVSALASFAFCYRMGPVENPRTINLIQWTMQLVALILIYLSSYHQVASFSLVMAILVWSSVPDKWKTQVQVQYHRKFVKPKVRLLSEQEYLDQSRVETEKALRELRDYCQSPKCNSWKHISTLSSPTRFAEFVQGSSHLTQDEVLGYSQVDDWDGEGGSGADEVGDDHLHNAAQLTDDDSSDEVSE